MKVHHVAITVKKLEESRRFYEKLFGFKLVEEFEKEEVQAKGCFLKLNDFYLELWEFKDMKENKDDFSDLKIKGIKHLSFEIEDIFETIKKLKEKGLIFSEPKEGKTCKWYSFASDPNEISLELYQKQ